MLRVALKMLICDRAKSIGLLFGITFTSFLVTFAASYFCGFMTRGFALVAENPAADVWVMDPAVIQLSKRPICRHRYWTVCAVLPACSPPCHWPWERRKRVLRMDAFNPFR